MVCVDDVVTSYGRLLSLRVRAAVPVNYYFKAAMMHERNVSDDMQH